MLSLAQFILGRQPAGFLLSRRRPQICGLAEFKPKLLLSRPEIYSKPAWGSMDGNVVDMVDSFTYLGTLVDRNGRSEAELVRRIAIARNCMTSLDRNIWRSSIFVSTKIRLYSVYVLPVFLHGAETWTLMKAMAAKVDAFDQWCQQRILLIHDSQHVTNTEVSRHTGCLPLSEIRSRRLSWFGHVARASPE